MNVIKVEYTVRRDYVKTNKKNIAAVMAELKGKKAPVKYFVSIKEDGKSFVHIAIYDKKASNIIPKLKAFKKFREQLNTGIVAPPKSEELKVIDSSFDIFD
jgi:hypothetical protein